MNSNSVTYAVDFDRCVSKDFASIPAEIKHKILARIKNLTVGPYPKGCKKISGSQNMFRLRQGPISNHLSGRRSTEDHFNCFGRSQERRLSVHLSALEHISLSDGNDVIFNIFTLGPEANTYIVH